MLKKSMKTHEQRCLSGKKKGMLYEQLIGVYPDEPWDNQQAKVVHQPFKNRKNHDPNNQQDCIADRLTVRRNQLVEPNGHKDAPHRDDRPVDGHGKDPVVKDLRVDVISQDGIQLPALKATNPDDTEQQTLLEHHDEEDCLEIAAKDALFYHNASKP
jgi:hypothetical protein